MKRKWNRVTYSHLQLHGRKLPTDGSWNVWKDKHGRIEIARFKYDAEDHFFPKCKIKEENIIAWRPLKSSLKIRKFFKKDKEFTRHWTRTTYLPEDIMMKREFDRPWGN